MKRRKVWGIGIGTALLLAALLAILSFGLAGLTTSHVHLSNHAHNAALAQDAARSVIATAIGRLAKDPEFGEEETGESLSHSGPERSRGALTFDEELSQQMGVPVSVNNLNGTSSVEGFEGALIPPSAVQLVAVGEVHGLKKTIVTTLHRPAFPYAIATRGPLRFEGGVLVAGLEGEPTGEYIDPGVQERLLPANVASASDSGEAIYIGPDTTVSGDVEASGGVVVNTSPTVEILGEVLSHRRGISVPEISFDDFELTERRSQELRYPTYGEPLSLEGSVRRRGDLIANEGLELDGAVLYVEGDLDVRKGVRGTGMIVVAGDTRVEGGARLNSSSVLAIASKGDIEFQGSGKEGSFFQGTIYTEGSLTADKITLMGTLIAAGEPHDVLLRDTRFFHTPGSGRVEFNLTASGSSGQAGQNFQVDGVDTQHRVWVYRGTGLANPNTLNEIVESSDDVNVGFQVVEATPTEITLQVTPPAGFGHLVSPIAFTDRAELVSQLEDLFTSLQDGNPGQPADRRANAAADAIGAGIRGLESLIGGGSNPGGPGTEATSGSVITFEPSSFLKFGDTIRVKSWREI